MNRIDLRVTTPKDLELAGIAEMHRQKEILGYHLSILNGDDNQLKFKLHKEVVYGN